MCHILSFLFSIYSQLICQFNLRTTLRVHKYQKLSSKAQLDNCNYRLSLINVLPRSCIVMSTHWWVSLGILIGILSGVNFLFCLDANVTEENNADNMKSHIFATNDKLENN